MVEDDAPPSVPKPKTVPPPVLGPNPTLNEVVDYLRELSLYTEAVAWASRTHSSELKGIREQMQAHGMRIEGFCTRIEKAMHRFIDLAQEHDTDPPPSKV